MYFILTRFCVWYTAQKNYSNVSPLAVKAIHQDTYVDDLTSPVRSEDDAWSMIQDISKLLSATGFKMTKWSSNSKVIPKRTGNDYLEKY